nr:hypothetical protein [Clostridium cadaveris]
MKDSEFISDILFLVRYIFSNFVKLSIPSGIFDRKLLSKNIILSEDNDLRAEDGISLSLLPEKDRLVRLFNPSKAFLSIDSIEFSPKSISTAELNPVKSLLSIAVSLFVDSAT